MKSTLHLTISETRKREILWTIRSFPILESRINSGEATNYERAQHEIIESAFTMIPGNYKSAVVEKLFNNTDNAEMINPGFSQTESKNWIRIFIQYVSEELDKYEIEALSKQ